MCRVSWLVRALPLVLAVSAAGCTKRIKKIPPPTGTAPTEEQGQFTEEAPTSVGHTQEYPPGTTSYDTDWQDTDSQDTDSQDTDGQDTDTDGLAPPWDPPPEQTSSDPGQDPTTQDPNGQTTPPTIPIPGTPNWPFPNNEKKQPIKPNMTDGQTTGTSNAPATCSWADATLTLTAAVVATPVPAATQKLTYSVLASAPTTTHSGGLSLQNLAPYKNCTQQPLDLHDYVAEFVAPTDGTYVFAATAKLDGAATPVPGQGDPVLYAVQLSGTGVSCRATAFTSPTTTPTTTTTTAQDVYCNDDAVPLKPEAKLRVTMKSGHMIGVVVNSFNPASNTPIALSVCQAGTSGCT